MTERAVYLVEERWTFHRWWWWLMRLPVGPSRLWRGFVERKAEQVAVELHDLDVIGAALSTVEQRADGRVLVSASVLGVGPDNGADPERGPAGVDDEEWT